MGDILIKAGCYVAIIVLGYVLRKAGFFGPEAFGVLSKVVIKITLPAAIRESFGLMPGSMILVLADTEKGIALVNMGQGPEDGFCHQSPGKDTEA